MMWVFILSGKWNVYQYLCTNLSGNGGLCVLNLFLFLLNIGFVITCHMINANFLHNACCSLALSFPYFFYLAKDMYKINVHKFLKTMTNFSFKWHIHVLITNINLFWVKSSIQPFKWIWNFYHSYHLNTPLCRLLQVWNKHISFSWATNYFYSINQ